jgi:hypothetical protein
VGNQKVLQERGFFFLHQSPLIKLLFLLNQVASTYRYDCSLLSVLKGLCPDGKACDVRAIYVKGEYPEFFLKESKPNVSNERWLDFCNVCAHIAFEEAQVKRDKRNASRVDLSDLNRVFCGKTERLLGDYLVVPDEPCAMKGKWSEFINLVSKYLSNRWPSNGEDVVGHCESNFGFVSLDYAEEISDRVFSGFLLTIKRQLSHL